MRTLDFNKTKKQYLTIILPDEDKTRLQLLTPTKGLLTRLALMIPDNSGSLPDDQELGDLFTFCAELMSRNKTGRKVTGEELAECLDLEDLLVFMGEYTDFVNEVAGQKN